MDVESVDFVSVLTRDIPRARRFYSEVLGLEIESEGESPAGIAIRVPDVAAARAELEARGIAFVGEIVHTSVCDMTFFKDPDGNALILHRRFAPFPDGRMP